MAMNEKQLGGYGGGGEMTKPASKPAAKAALIRPGEGITPSGVLHIFGLVVWWCSALATAYGAFHPIRFVLVALAGALKVELPGLVTALVAAPLTFGLAFLIQRYITAMERPLFEGHFSVPILAVALIDLGLNLLGVYAATFVFWPVQTDTFRFGITTVVGALLTVAPEGLFSLSLIEKRKGY